MLVLWVIFHSLNFIFPFQGRCDRWRVVPIKCREWGAPIVDEVDATSKLEGVPNMVETIALIEDTVGVVPTKIIREFLR